MHDDLHAFLPDVPVSKLAFLLTLALLCINSARAADSWTVSYTVEEPADVSVGIYDQRGRLLRSLVYAQPHETGRFKVEWDGLTRDGDPVEPGSYEYRVLKTPGIRAEYIMPIGTNITPEENPEAYAWIGRQSGPTAVDVGPDGTMYLGGRMSERASAMVKYDLTRNLVRWGRVPGHPVQIAEVGDWVLSLTHKGRMRHYRADNGWTPYQIFNRRIIQPPEVGGKYFDATHEFIALSIPEENQVSILAYRFEKTRINDSLSLYFLKENYPEGPFRKVGRVLRIEPVRTIEVPSPKGVAIDPERNVLYVISGTKVVRIDPEAGSKREIISDDALETPTHVAYCAATGDLLVAQTGEAGNVRRYDAASGEFLRAYGRPRGRGYGPYDPRQFGDITDIAADRDGGFIVTESFPRRTVRFDEEGNVLRQWHGGQNWQLNTCLDPGDRTVAYFQGTRKYMARVKINWDERSWRYTHLYEPPEKGFSTRGRRWAVRRVDGTPYVVTRKGGTPAVFGIDHESGTFEVLRRAEVSAPYHMDDNWDIYASPEGSETVRVWKNQSPDGLPGWPEKATRSYEIKYSPFLKEGVKNRARGAGMYHDAEGNTYKFFGLEASKSQDDIQGEGWPVALVGRTRLVKWNPDGEILWNVGRHQVMDKFTPKPAKWTLPIELFGEVKGCISAQDRMPNNSQFFTKDGLYVGGSLLRRVDDDLHQSYYRYQRYRGALVGDMLHNSLHVYGDEVYFIGCGPNQSPVYKLHGWDRDRWRRETGKIHIEKTPPHARRQGTGLTGEYFDNTLLRGEPVLTRLDRDIWFGPWADDHVYSTAGRRWWGEAGSWNQNKDRFQKMKKQRGWHRKKAKSMYKFGIGTMQGQPFDQDGFSVRWSGRIEPELSEDYMFTLAVFGRSWSIVTKSKGLVEDRSSNMGARVRMWVDGRKVIDRWKDIEMTEYEDSWWVFWTRWEHSLPVPLRAGEKVPVRIELATNGGWRAQAHLMWESLSQEREHVPQKSLYPRPR